MVDQVFAIMYDIGPRNPMAQTNIPRRYELAIVRCPSLEAEVAATVGCWDNDPTNTCLRVGFKELPDTPDLGAVASQLFQAYPGSSVRDSNPSTSTIVYHQGTRPNARTLMAEQEFVMD